MARFSSNGIFFKLLIITALVAGVVAIAEDDVEDIFSSVEQVSAMPCSPKVLGCDCTGENDAACQADIEGEVECRVIQSNRECRCKADNIGNEDGNKCFPIVKEDGGACEVDEQCNSEDGLGEEYECSDNTCSRKSYNTTPASSVNLTVPVFVILLGLTVSKLFNV